MTRKVVKIYHKGREYGLQGSGGGDVDLDFATDEDIAALFNK